MKKYITRATVLLNLNQGGLSGLRIIEIGENDVLVDSAHTMSPSILLSCAMNKIICASFLDGWSGGKKKLPRRELNPGLGRAVRMTRPRHNH